MHLPGQQAGLRPQRQTRPARQRRLRHRGRYRAAVQDAGDAIYPYIQGRAGNRTAAGFSALAASAAAAPFPAAAYTAVLTARLLLRLGLIAGLFVGIGMMVRPHLARRVLNVIAGSLLVVLLFSAAGALMTYLSMVMLSPTTVAGYPDRPDRRGDHPGPGLAGRMAADPPDQTHHRHAVLRRHRQPAPAVRPAAPGDGRPAAGSLHCPAGAAAAVTGSATRRRTRPDPVTPTEPARPSRPEQATIARRRNTTPQPAAQPARRRLTPDPGRAAEPPTTPIPRITPATGRLDTGGRPPVSAATRPGSFRSSRPRATGRPAGPGPSGRPAGSHPPAGLERPRWVLADDDRVFHPAPPDRPAPRRPTTRRCSGHRTRRPGPTTADPKPAPPAGPTPSTTRGGPDERSQRLALAPTVPRPAHRPGPRRPRPGPDHQDRPRHRRQHRRTRGRPDRGAGHPRDHHRNDQADRGADQPGRVRRAMGQGTRPGRLPVPGVRLHPLSRTDPRPDQRSTTPRSSIGVPSPRPSRVAAPGTCPKPTRPPPWK